MNRVDHRDKLKMFKKKKKPLRNDFNKVQNSRTNIVILVINMVKKKKKDKIGANLKVTIILPGHCFVPLSIQLFTSRKYKSSTLKKKRKESIKSSRVSKGM